MSKAFILSIFLVLLLGSSNMIYAGCLTGSDSYFDDDSKLIAPLVVLDKLSDGKIHVGKWKKKVCYLTVERASYPTSSGITFYTYVVSLSRDKHPDVDPDDANDHIEVVVEDRCDFASIGKNKIVLKDSGVMKRASLAFYFDSKTAELTKVVGKYGVGPITTSVMKGLFDGKQAKTKKVFKKLYQK